MIIALGLSAQCFATQTAKSFNDQSINPGNYYIQQGGIYIAPNGIDASIDGILIQIHTLCADERGIFVPYEEIIAGNLEWCSFCGKWYDPEYGHSDCPGFPESKITGLVCHNNRVSLQIHNGLYSRLFFIELIFHFDKKELESKPLAI